MGFRTPFITKHMSGQHHCFFDLSISHSLTETMEIVLFWAKDMINGSWIQVGKFEKGEKLKSFHIMSQEESD